MIGESALYLRINEAFVPLSLEAKERLREKHDFLEMKEVKGFDQLEAERLLADIESEKGSAS
jgi:hypothetical protein